MARHTITNGGTFEVLNRAELTAALDKQTIDWFQEQARGLSTARFDGQAVVASAAVTIPAAGSPNRLGPKMGFAWAVQRVTAVGLLTGDTLGVYRSALTPHNFLGVLTPTTSLHIGSKSIILRSDENLVITGNSLSATGDIVITGEAIEVPETDLFKLL